jgi:lipopolysaccharide biosynthesis regulator YciM
VLLRRSGREAAISYLVTQLQKHPTMRGFQKLMQLYIDDFSDPASKQSLEQLQRLVSAQIEQRPRYRCHNCGFSGRKLHWLCPSCRKWNLVKPIKGLDGE